MPTPVTRYKCEYCKKNYSTNKDTIRHEKQCLFNPINKSCSTCGYSLIDRCLKYEKQIYVRGDAIRDCEGWEEFQDEIYEAF